MKILLVGHGRAGKDEAGLYLEKITNLTFAGTTSAYLCKHVARILRVSEEEAYRDRHKKRMLWRIIGDFIRRDDPLVLVKDAFAHGEISGGVRGYPEIVAAKEYVDWIIWIDNNRVPKDPTVEFSSREADIIIENHWSLEEYHERLKRFAKKIGIYEPQLMNAV